MLEFISALRRLFVVFLLATWWGGFTFYALAVIPSGHQVLRSRLRQGFITQRVTVRLNWLGVAAIAAAAVEVWAARKSPRRFRVLLGAWVVCAGTEAGLFSLHARMDELLDGKAMAITDQDRFDRLHEYYLWPATIGWGATAVMLGLLACPAKPREIARAATPGSR